MLLEKTLLLIETYKYFILLPLSILEGPIVAIISGFLISFDKLNFFLTFIILILGDLVGDAIHYAIGYYGKKKFKNIKPYLENPIRTLVLGKLMLGVGGLILINSGAAKYPFNKFLFYNFIATLIKTFLLLVIGFYFGKNYVLFDSYFGKITIIFLLISFFVILQYYMRHRKNENINSD